MVSGKGKQKPSCQQNVAHIQPDYQRLVIRDGSISGFQFRYDNDTVFTRYRDIDTIYTIYTRYIDNSIYNDMK